MLDPLWHWAEHSRLNPLRLLVAPPVRATAAEERAFDRLLERTHHGELVGYDLQQRKWIFLDHLVRRRGFLLHGSNANDIGEFQTRSNLDALGRPIDAVFAANDPIWPLYFATVSRAAVSGNGGYINQCVHVRGGSRYLFSVGADPAALDTWCDGTIYVLPGKTFRRTPGNDAEHVSLVPVRPRARLRVEPADFPFRGETRGHRRGDTPGAVAVRNALRSPELRSRGPARRRRRAS